MGLNIVQQSGEYKPFVKYNAKAGRWYFVKDGNETELNNPSFVIDFDNIKTGWFLFQEGMAPAITYDASLTETAPKPSEKHKRGFEVVLFSPKLFGGEAVFTAASMHVCNAVNELYVAYEEQRSANKGKLPVVTCNSTEAMKDKMGTNYKPKMSITKWTDRPSDLGAVKEEKTPEPEGVSEF